ncbi:MAG: PQQ-dependent sugar dehydrogenase [bacterium]|nr:PQQ-dependent sugar dehydrogenase [bacterium]
MRTILIIVFVALGAGACSDTDGTVGESSSTTTTAVLTTTAAPTTTTTVLAEATSSTSLTTTTSTTTTTTEPPPELLGVELVQVADMGHPLAIASPPGDPRLFVADRTGVIEIIGIDGVVVESPFIDLTDRVRANGIEQGLLGLVFHPSYADNGRFFVYYTDENDDSTLVEFAVSDDPMVADASSAKELLFLDQPTERHNAGMLEFGPDGYLYVAIGDGGDGGHNGQKPDTLFGTILRLDVDSGDPYAIPEGNPFVAGGGAAEVWAYGLRNPWRFSIDDGLIYIADVGQQDWEEVSVLPLDAGGANLGWAIREGSRCFSSPACEQTETVFPVLEYPHSEGCSITGGSVYRGEAIPELHGLYFYSDWCQGWIKSFRYENGKAVDPEVWSDLKPGQVNTFGTDAAGELYIGTWSGELWKLSPIRAEK